MKRFIFLLLLFLLLSACVPAPTPASTSTPTTAPPPKATPLTRTPLSPYEEYYGEGKCTNGFYCCQQTNGDPACCHVGQVSLSGAVFFST